MPHLDTVAYPSCNGPKERIIIWKDWKDTFPNTEKTPNRKEKNKLKEPQHCIIWMSKKENVESVWEVSGRLPAFESKNLSAIRLCGLPR